jgi:isoquinoline 1-oxidoreductase beta subunit
MTKHVAIESCTISRRRFLVGTGALSIGIAFGGLPRNAFAAGELTPNAWVSIGADGIVTIMSAPQDIGQGTKTALPAALAEDLDADWSKVRVVQSPANPALYGNPKIFGQMRTLGSLAVMGYYEPVRLAGAQARKVLIANAATMLSVPADELTTEPGMVVHAKSGRKLGYGEIAKSATVPNPLPKVTAADLKPLAQCRLIGKDLPRVDIPEKVTGKAIYGHDVQLPGMLYGAVLFSPVEGEKPMKIDDKAAKAVKGIVAIVPLADGVGVVGDTVEGTQKAKRALKVKWSNGSMVRKYNSAKVLEDYRAIAHDQNQAGVDMVKSGDAAAALKGAAKVIAADFYADHIAHTQMEPLNATAKVDGDKVELWLSNQSPSATMFACAMAVGTKPENVTVHSQLVGGAFGRTSDDADHAAYAAQLAKAVPGRPVKMIWTREDDFRNDKFRQLAAQRVEVGLDKANNIVGWRHRIVAEAYFARVAPPLVKIFHGQDIVSAGDGDFRYAVPAHLVQYVATHRGFETGAWRGTASGYTKFAIETMIDEVAAMKGVDPVAFRLSLLEKEPRGRKVIETVAKMADWDKKREGRALGIGYSDARGSYTAAVAEISFNRRTGVIKVHKVWAAIDPGVALQPANIVAQAEGSITMALGASLFERVDVKHGRPGASNFDGYRVPRMSDVPEIKVEVISTDNPPTGVGEVFIPQLAPAIANAFAKLTGGKRLRQLPMSPERVKAVLRGA